MRMQKHDDALERPRHSMGRLVVPILAFWLLLMLILLSRARAQDEAAPAKKQSKPDAAGAGDGNRNGNAIAIASFFAATQVDFWGERKEEPQGAAMAKRQESEERRRWDGIKRDDKPAPPAKAASSSELWKEPVVSADGTVSSYTPPAALLRLLEDPTEENAIEYLQWQRRRIEKILRAQKAIARAQQQLLEASKNLPGETEKQSGSNIERQRQERVRPSRDPGETSPPQDPWAGRLPVPSQPERKTGSARIDTDWGAAAVEIAYFFSPDCPHCERQDAIVKALSERRPGLRVSRFDVRAQPEMAAALGVRATPTLILRVGPSGRLGRMEGVAEERAIVAAVKALVVNQAQEEDE